MRAVVEEYLLSDLGEPSYPDSRIDPDRLGPLAGRYVEVTRRFPGSSRHRVLDVIVDGTKLITRDEEGRARDLLPVSDRWFRRSYESVATTAFIDHGGELYLQGPVGNYRRVSALLEQ